MAGELAVQSKALPEPVVRRGITDAQWRTLCKNLYPGAHPESVLMVWDYCKSRQLDPMKKPCHIVPMKVKNQATGNYDWRDVVMPGIYEYRTTAQRTGEYLGHSRPIYGPPLEQFGVLAPEWCELTIYRWNGASGQKVEFPVCAFFKEACAVTKDKQTGRLVANDRWSKAPIQMLTKCTEAAGLREAFPDELGGEPTAEEMDGQRAGDITVTVGKAPAPKPDGYDDWFVALASESALGAVKLGEAFAKAAPAFREYLTAHDADSWEQLKANANGADVENEGDA
jgi:phage recombination protein Bet